MRLQVMFAKAKRRRAGIYLVRTRKHRGRRRENGYVGRSNNVPIRIKQHLGQDKRHKPKPWTDLDPVWHTLRLPWWASWKWVQAPLEAFAIWLFLPRYNDKLNHGNPRRVTISQQHRQRAARDSGRTPVTVISARPALLLSGSALLLLGLFLMIKDLAS